MSDRSQLASDTAINLGMDIYTTRTNQVFDSGIVDMGFHYNYIESNPADLDFNRDVDVDDLKILSAHWLEDTRELLYEPNEVGWWEFDEGAGSVAYDSSVYGNDGTLIGDPNWVTGKYGDALEFDGSGDYVEMDDPNYKGITGTQSRTCAAWIKTTTAKHILSWGSNTFGEKWVFRVNTIDGAIRAEVAGGYIIGTTNITDDNWHHVAAVLKEDATPNVSDIKLYVDGVEESISNVSAQAINTASEANVKIGSYNGNADFIGPIDDVRIYDYALTDEMIEQLYQGQQPSGFICLEEPVGDLNGDCIVNMSDFLIFAQEWLWEQ